MVKIGIRKPSWKISIAARTKGQLNRKIKRAIIRDMVSAVLDGLIPNESYTTRHIVALHLALMTF